MNRLVVPIMLQNQHRRFHAAIRIVFDKLSGVNARKQIAKRNIVGGQLAEAVPVDAIIAAEYQRLHATQRFAHDA
jgi:hypothetical protein